MPKENLQTATLAGGCFWCTEAIFQRLKGVESVTSGYTGGSSEKPNYHQIAMGNTGHTEAIQIIYNPRIISFEKLLEIFFALHDSTTLNRQGADVGTQYRSAIFYHDKEQKQAAQNAKTNVENSTTEITPFTKFYKAEEEHKNYYDANRSQPYCQIVIDPKITKLYEEFKNEVKPVAS